VIMLWGECGVGGLRSHLVDHDLVSDGEMREEETWWGREVTWET
jgi:hypothetical protein